MNKVIDELTILFEEAKNSSEFDFVLTLINYKGMGNRELMTNLYEWFDAINFYKELYNSLSGKEKTRIAALLYSTFFENSDFYNIIGSLCRIRLGYKGSSYLFWKTKKYERFLGTGEKQDFLMELLSDADKHNIINFFNDNHFKNIRNTFFHSTYSLSDEDYILHDSEPIVTEGTLQSSFNVESFFYPKVENVIILFENFKNLYLDNLSSYKQNKEVLGSFPNTSQIILLGSDEGLKGFKIENSVQFYDRWYDSGIWYDEKYDMWAGHNISMYFDNLETIEINDQINRYENKNDIHKSDEEFQNLINKVKERQHPIEIQRAVQLLVKFGDIRYKKMEEEQNPYKKQNLPKQILPYYKKAIEIGSELFDMTDLKKVVSELEV